MPDEAVRFADLSGAPPARFILLGASNLTHALPRAMARLGDREVTALPAEILIAAGAGRSYGIESTVLCRTLPGIVQCGLWSHPGLEGGGSMASARTLALITDVGNDIMYHRTPMEIIEWVEICVGHLRRLEARIIMTALPLARIERLSERGFLMARRVLFPRNTLTFAQARDAAEATDARLRDLASHHDLPIITPQAAWYGADPIHIRPRCIDALWDRIFDVWDHCAVGPAAGPVDPSRRAVEAPLPQTTHVDPRTWMQMRTARPETMRVFGITWRTPQPSIRLRNGSLVSLY